MKVFLRALLAVGMALMFTACATIGPPQPPSLELPRPPKDLRATRKGDRVTLTWTVPGITTDRQTVRSTGATRICRGLEPLLTACGKPVGEAAPQPPPGTKSVAEKVAGSYVDALPIQMESDDPSSFVTYAVEVLNAAGRSGGLSNGVRVPLARTLPAPQNFSAAVTNQGVELTWTSEHPPVLTPAAVRYIDRVYRRREGSQQQVLAGESPAGGEHTLTDPNIEWEKTYEYHAETVTIIASDNKPALQIEGDDTPEVKVFAHDTFPPSVPSGLQAVFSGPGQKAFIDLIWAPVTDADLDGYNVYRQENGSAVTRINSEPLKTPAYRDMNLASGKRYVYSVSAADVHGNESARSEEAGEAVP